MPVSPSIAAAGDAEPAAAPTGISAARKRKNRAIAAETRIGLVRRARRMNRTLGAAFPDAHCELDFTTPLELAVATWIPTDRGRRAGVHLSWRK